MEDDREVTVMVTPEDMEFRARAKAAGLPDVLISMYGTALRRLVTDERERLEYRFKQLEALMQVRERQPNKPCCLAQREACAAFLDRGVDLSGLAEHPRLQRYSADLLTACAAAIRARGITQDQPLPDDHDGNPSF